ATDACGISRYTLERRVNGGAWAALGLSSATSTSVVQSLSFGAAYRYVVNATDGAGNTTGWVYGPTFEPVLTQQSSTAITYAGSWHPVANSYASGGSLTYSTAAGATATYRFT